MNPIIPEPYLSAAKAFIAALPREPEGSLRANLGLNRRFRRSLRKASRQGTLRPQDIPLWVLPKLLTRT